MEALDLQLVREARLALGAPQGRARAEPEEAEEAPGTGQAILGELLAIFPGVLVSGLGHYYAGDAATARRLNRVGLVGEGFLLAGAGMGVGGYFILEDAEDLDDDFGQVTAGSLLVGVGGALGVAGLLPFLTAWFYDMIDTPRAVLSGGQPAPTPEILKGVDYFGPEIDDWDEP